ncbi:toprim domain-containing protein (plasmid) [Cupriavidus metallidurans]|uniref:toprim domain-containing protein n=1 Tax=Cupriavidus metallidurans TaxID=119219 RepID=UPI003D762A08
MANSNSKDWKVDFSKVRKDFPLDWVFERMLGAIPKPMSGTIRYSICPNPECGASSEGSVKVSVKDDTWKCFACNKHGDVIEAASLYLGKSPLETALELSGADTDAIRSYTPPKPKPAIERDDSALQEVFSKLVAALPEPSRDGIEYLAGRGISPEITRTACRKGILLTLPSNPKEAKEFLLRHIGQDLMTRAGLWKEGSKAPAAAFRPLVLVSNNRRAAEFRYLRATRSDEVKSLRYGTIAPWGWLGESKQRILITEGCIDLLSAVALGTKRSIMGLPGCENWRPEWFETFRGADVLAAFDDDDAGRTALEKIRPVLEAAVGGPIGTYTLPPGAKDLNEELKLKLGLKM